MVQLINRLNLKSIIIKFMKMIIYQDKNKYMTSEIEIKRYTQNKNLRRMTLVKIKVQILDMVINL